MSAGTRSVSKRRYRWLDIGTKLGGMGLLAAGLHVGITSALGVALALAGVVLGVSTVFVTEDTS